MAKLAWKPKPKPTPAPALTEITRTVRFTAYADQDNTPANSDQIAYPKSDGYPTVHNVTGGTGTEADPITIAADIREYPIGTRIYEPALKFYGIIEDYCQAAVDRHNKGIEPDILDIFVGGKGAPAQQVADYENTITGKRTVIVNPKSGKPVIVGPLYETHRSLKL